MRDTSFHQQVICRKCRYTFAVEVPSEYEWLVEAVCPVCEVWACFTMADTAEHQTFLPDPEEQDQAIQRLGEQLWQPIREHSNHPSLAWFDRVGNGVFEDDHSIHCWPVPCWVYRFSRKREAAYIWQEEGAWLVRGWHPVRSRRKPPDPAEVFSFEMALDRLYKER